MRKKITFIILILILLVNFTNVVYAIDIPENDINLRIENLTRGCKIYLLLPENLLKYNMEKFISNNINNSYTQESQKAQKLQEFLDNKDYVGYVNYYRDLGFNQTNSNEIELRHYCFAMQATEIVGELEYNDITYVQVKINLSDENRFKIVIKDYLINYNTTDIKFMVDEYGSITYIDLDKSNFVPNLEKPHIKECNILYTYYDKDEFDSIERYTNITFLILLIILIIIHIIIIFFLVKRYIKKRKEKEERKFWKKKLTKEKKKKLKEANKENRKFK